MHRSVRRLAIAVLGFLTSGCVLWISCRKRRAERIKWDASRQRNADASPVCCVVAVADTRIRRRYPTRRPLLNARQNRHAPNPRSSRPMRPELNRASSRRPSRPTCALAGSPASGTTRQSSSRCWRRGTGSWSSTVRWRPMVMTGSSSIRARNEGGRVLPTGWVAAGKDGEQSIKPLELECPPVPTDVDDMRGLASDYQLSCFGESRSRFPAASNKRATHAPAQADRARVVRSLPDRVRPQPCRAEFIPPVPRERLGSGR